MAKRLNSLLHSLHLLGKVSDLLLWVPGRVAASSGLVCLPLPSVEPLPYHQVGVRVTGNPVSWLLPLGESLHPMARGLVEGGPLVQLHAPVIEPLQLEMRNAGGLPSYSLWWHSIGS